MRPRELVSVAVGDGLFSDKRAGKTPHQTMKSKLSVDVRRNGDRSDFVRTGPGLFYLRRLLDENQSEYKATPITKRRSAEAVLAFDADWFPPHDRFQGVSKKWRSLFRQLLKPGVCEYIPRLKAEHLDTHKQILTYVMVTRAGAVLAFKRGNYNRVEDYLRGSHCIGFGGHVSDADLSLFGASGMGVTDGAIRELHEELHLPNIDKRRLQIGDGLECVGVLNDDLSKVGQRHLAFIYRYEVSDDPRWISPLRGEKSITKLRWLSPRSFPLPIWHFEYWSQLCLREYFPKLVHAAPAYRIRRKQPLRPPHVLCVLGTIGSGKSEATKILREQFDYREVNTGKLLATLLKVRPVPETPRAAFQRKAWDYIKEDGAPKRFAHAIWTAVRSMKHPRILIDGIRQRRTLEELRTLASAFRLGVLFVHTTPDLAYTFYREREGGNISIFDFLNLRNAPVESEVEEMIGMSDAVLYNWTGRVEYRRAVKALIASL